MTVRSDDANGCGRAIRERDRSLDDILARDRQGIEYDDRYTLRLRVHHGGDGICSARQDLGELVHGQHFVVPGVLVGFGDARAREDVMELGAHHESPCLCQAVQGVGTPSQQFGGDGSLLSGVGEYLVLAVPALHISLGGDGTGGVIDQLEVAFVLRQPGDLFRRQIPKHLIGSRGNDLHGTIPDLNLGRGSCGRLRLAASVACTRR